MRVAGEEKNMMGVSPQVTHLFVDPGENKL